MPKETIWGSMITVRDGDLPVMAARTRAELADVTPLVERVPLDPRDAGSEPERRVQQTVTLSWGRDEGEVRLFTAAWDHGDGDRPGEPVDLGGHWVTLDWTAVNKFIHKLRVARDQSCGTPE